MKKSNAIFVILIGVASLMQLSCGSSVSLINVWTDPGYHGGKLDKLLVVGMAPREQTRSIFEYQLTNDLNVSGVKAMASLDGMPKDEEISKEAFEKYFRDLNIDGVLVTGLIRADTTEKFVEGHSYAIQSGYYRDFWGYYHSQWTVYSEPGYFVESEEYLIETTLYETTNAKIIWRGISKAVDPKHAVEVIEDLSKILVNQLIEDSIVVVAESEK